MKVTVYLRVAHGARGPRVWAGASPSYEPLMSGSGFNAKPLPTAAFAIRMEIPEEAFRRAAEVLADITVAEKDIRVAADVQAPVAEAQE